VTVIFRYKLYHHQTENAYKIRGLSSYKRYTQENRQNSLLDFIPLLSDPFAVSLYVAETPKASIKDQEPPLPIIHFGIVAHVFVGYPFSKQL